LNPSISKKMTDFQVVLCGYYGEGNGGDEALLASMLEMLPANVKPLVLSADPAQTYQRYGVAAIPRKSLKVIAALRASRAFILGGGSLLQDATSVQSAVYYGGLVGLAEQFGLQTMAIGQGIGPLNQPLSQWIAKRAFGSCAALSVRDVASAFLLQEWGITCMMAPDPVWNLTATPVPELAELPSPRIAITLRRHPQLTPQRLQAITMALIELQKATNSYILIVPFQPRSDLEIAEGLQAALPGVSQIVLERDPRRLKGVFQNVQMAIGMRYHSLIMAAAEGSICTWIGYDPKISQLVQDLELPGWELANLPTDPAQILNSWLTTYQTGQPLSDSKIAELRSKTNLHRELLAAALKNFTN
jgi:polysaccharide pyruvyl transferase CsaB